MINTISATEARHKFADIINRIQYRGEEFIIEKQGKPVAIITVAGKTSQKKLGQKTSFNLPTFNMGGEDRVFTSGDIYDR